MVDDHSGKTAGILMGHQGTIESKTKRRSSKQGCVTRKCLHGHVPLNVTPAPASLWCTHSQFSKAAAGPSPVWPLTSCPVNLKLTLGIQFLSTVTVIPSQDMLSLPVTWPSRHPLSLGRDALMLNRSPEEQYAFIISANIKNSFKHLREGLLHEDLCIAGPQPSCCVS